MDTAEITPDIGMPPGFELEPEPVIPPGFELHPPEDPTKPPEPIKPNHVDRPSPATPNAPTAAAPTVPEKPETLDIQLQQLGGGIRKAVMLPKGTPHPTVYPPNTALTSDAFGNQYIFRPDLIRKSEIRSAAKNNKLTEVLGSSILGMGGPDKTALGTNPVTVSVHDRAGNEVQSTATDERHFPATIAASKHLRPQGGKISIHTPQRAVYQRLTPPVDLSIPSELK